MKNSPPSEPSPPLVDDLRRMLAWHGWVIRYEGRNADRRGEDITDIAASYIAGALIGLLMNQERVLPKSVHATLEAERAAVIERIEQLLKDRGILDKE